MFILAGAAGAMDLVWTRTTGQFRPESAPVVVEGIIEGDPLLVCVNLGGQVMAWRLDGTDFGRGQDGRGQDGTVYQLPEGKWSSSPAVVNGETVLVFCSVEGQVIALDREFTLLWEQRLAEETWWARATPVVLTLSGKDSMFLGDKSGTITCIQPDGTVAWQVNPGEGPCRSRLAVMQAEEGPLLLAPLGAALCCFTPGGDLKWTHRFAACHPNGTMLASPVFVKQGSLEGILCGVEDSLYALTPEGEILWMREISSTLDATIALMPRPGLDPLILCQGLWGNLQAFDLSGQPVWTHLYRSKSRTQPLVADFDGDGQQEAVVTAYNQRVLLINAKGERTDEVRLSGLISAAPTPIHNGAGTDMVIVTGTLLAHRLHAGDARATYGTPAETGAVRVSAMRNGNQPGILVDNPDGTFLRAAARWTAEDGADAVASALTARSRFEMPLPDLVGAARVTVKLGRGDVLFDEDVQVPPVLALEIAKDALHAWPTQPYADFDETLPRPDAASEIRVEPLYVGEVDQGAFIVASSFDEPVPVRIAINRPVLADKAPFAGAIVPRQVVTVGTVNGERAADALPALNDASVVVIPAHRAIKIWLSIDAHDAAPGEYAGSVAVAPIDPVAAAITLPLTIAVPDLAMPTPLPLTLCTWDYVPNNWFAESAPETLDDMARHGVNVFPRSDLPPGSVDAAGKLAMDWTKLDETLDRLRGRGQILFHLCQPPLSFSQSPGPEQTHAFEVEYVRAFRDHLLEKGLDYNDFAFYPVDEPGLDYGPRVPVYMAAAQLFREADPKLRVYTDPVPGLSLKDYEQIEPLTDVWCPNMRLVNGLLAGDPRIRRIMDSGKPVWSYECVSQVRSLSPLCYNRANAWRAWYFGLDGIGFWTHCTTPTDPWLTGKTMNDEYALVYPGDKPVPSIRWEAVRDGLEDIAAFALLKQRVEERRGSDAEIVKQAEKLLATALVDVMELSDQAFIESRDFLCEGDRRIWHSPADVELFGNYRRQAATLTLALTE
ncbi:MAG TPA: glycoside hydrolase domain-containing protein [Candidatus Bathyarchaeia archaeon]|nr:glycoside hydrolase domain-containing protein [Candidatus Bathyarchaeia archaeon]